MFVFFLQGSFLLNWGYEDGIRQSRQSAVAAWQCWSLNPNFLISTPDSFPLSHFRNNCENEWEMNVWLSRKDLSTWVTSRKLCWARRPPGWNSLITSFTLELLSAGGEHSNSDSCWWVKKITMKSWNISRIKIRRDKKLELSSWFFLNNN